MAGKEGATTGEPLSLDAMTPRFFRPAGYQPRASARGGRHLPAEALNGGAPYRGAKDAPGGMDSTGERVRCQRTPSLAPAGGAITRPMGPQRGQERARARNRLCTGGGSTAHRGALRPDHFQTHEPTRGRLGSALRRSRQLGAIRRGRAGGLFWLRATPSTA
jgi:hypothetical protein